MSAAPPVDTAQTYGWDTVFAIHIADANAAIAAAKTSPPNWRQVDAADGYTVSGNFGNWEIVPGGSGDIVRLGLPLVDTTILTPTGTEDAAGVATADIRLDLLHDADVANRKHLKVRTTSPGDGIPVASVVDVTFTGTGPSFLAGVAVKQLLQDWLNANLGDFDHVFATVDLDRRAATGAFQWMQPTDAAYAYTDFGSSTDGALAILSMTGSRDSTGLIQQVSSVCIPPGQRASLLISRARVMDQILLPGMPLTFKGAAASNFQLSSTGESIVNSDLGTSFSVTSEGKDYNASIVALSATIAGKELTFDVTTKVDLSPGIHAYTRTISTLNMTLVKAAGGGQALDFSNVRDPVVTHWTDADEGIKLTEEILGIAAIVAALIATVATDGAAIGALAIAIGFAAGVLTLTETAIQMAGKDGAPQIDAAVLDATAAVLWPKASGFVLSDAGLNDSLQLTGAYAPS